jgi:hypothetical protein
MSRCAEDGQEIAAESDDDGERLKQAVSDIDNRSSKMDAQ